MTTFVLVPGAWMGGWVWGRIIPMLEKRGHRTVAVTLTGMGERVHLASPEIGIDTAIQDVLNVIEYNELDDFVLVGHSFAGKVVAAVADRVPEKVKLVLYLDAFRPEKVRTPQGGFDPTKEFGPLPEGTYGVPFTEKVVGNIGRDVMGADLEWMLSKATPWPVKLATDSIIISGRLDSVKCAYVFCTLSGDPVDEIVVGRWGRLEGPYRLIEAGHWPMVTKPAEMVQAMLDLA